MLFYELTDCILQFRSKNIRHYCACADEYTTNLHLHDQYAHNFIKSNLKDPITLIIELKDEGKIYGKTKNFRNLAEIGLSAFEALSYWQKNKAPTTQIKTIKTVDRVFGSEAELHGKAILFSILAAAKVDENFDDFKRHAIQHCLAGINSSQEIQFWINQELRKPLDPLEVASYASSLEVATEMYLASNIILSNKKSIDRMYLEYFSLNLVLDPLLKNILEKIDK